MVHTLIIEFGLQLKYITNLPYLDNSFVGFPIYKLELFACDRWSVLRLILDIFTNVAIFADNLNIVVQQR
jgi:hypothetical protein